MGKPYGLMKPYHLVKPVSATRVSGRYLTHQKGLPTLPVPCLQQTCERYVTALEPILEADELQHTKELVEDFKKVGGVGRSLQCALEERARNCENWVSFWMGDNPICINAHLMFMFLYFFVPVAVRVVGAGCLSYISAACGGSFKSWFGLTLYEFQG